MPQAGKETELMGIAETAYHSQLLLSQNPRIWKRRDDY